MIRSLFLAPLVVLGTALVGCQYGGDGTEPVDTTTSTLETAAGDSTDEGKPACGASARHDGFGPGGRGPMGPLALVGAAIRHAELTDAQTQKLRAALDQAHRASPPPFVAGRKIDALLSSGVATGTLDRPALDREVDAIVDDATARAAKDAAVLDLLHQTLDPAQRRALVDAVGQKMARKSNQGGASDATGPKRARSFDRHAALGRGELRGLDLSESQSAALENGLSALERNPASDTDLARRHEEHTARMKSLLEAFAADAFGASDHLDARTLAGGVREHWQRRITTTELLLPILTVEQRAVYAQRLTAGPRALARQRTAPALPSR